MDLNDPPWAASFRPEVRDWAEAELSRLRAEVGNDQRALNDAWQKLLHASGWSVPTWPTEYGGRGLSALQEAIAAEEFASAGAPLQQASGGELLLGPTILAWGTSEQRKRFLPSIAKGTESWCQGFSEPEAGSDLASLTTSAIKDDDGWLITGRKIWTSEADSADFMFALAVTDPDASRRHDGITYFLIPMRQQGIEVRLIAQPDGRAGFTEVVLDNARCPGENVLGDVGAGWRVAMGTLGIERGINPVANHHRWQRELDDVIATARTTGAMAEPSIRNRLVQAWADLQLLRLNSYRTLTAAVNRKTEWGASGVQAIHKFRYTEFSQRLAELALDVRGAQGQLLTGDLDAPSPPGVGMGKRVPLQHYPANDVQAAYFFSLASTIYGGTSQIQRNIVAERILGLPR